jgi:hypothetical protein
VTEYRIVVTTTELGRTESHIREGVLSEFQAAQELAAERLIHELDGWEVRDGIGRVVCHRKTAERTIEAREHRT